MIQMSNSLRKCEKMRKRSSDRELFDQQYQMLEFAMNPKKKKHDHGPKAKEQKICPVMGYEINKKIYADHKDKRVYFCCPSCIGKFKENPEKYIKKLQNEGIEPEKIKKAKKGNSHEH